MRIVQTYNTFDGDALRMNAGFPTLRSLKLFLQKSYAAHSKFDFMFYTDSHGYDVVKGFMKDKHITVVKFPHINDYIPYIGKFHTHSLQKDPYIHVDLDAILFEPPIEATEDVLTEKMRPVGFGREIDALEMDADVYKRVKHSKLSVVKTNMFSEIICSGLIGFNDMKLQKEYIKAVYGKIDKVKKKKLEVDFNICFTIEETLLTAMVVKQNKTIKKICPCAYIHLQGNRKYF